MSDPHATHALARPWRRVFHARDPHEPHRAATPLELLFDLAFVVAIASLASSFHHALGAHHALSALPLFAMVFFAIWWAWMNFTWLASAYDNDDVPYRLKVLLQIAGVLVVAAGVPRAAERGDFTLVTVGYTIMRVALVGHWLRAAAHDPARARTARRYALGLTLVQTGWVMALFLPRGAWPFAAAGLVIAELAVPLWAERVGHTPWHPHHIAERYGLLTLILLGESVLAATIAIRGALDTGGLGIELALFVAGALLTLFSMWWIYFDVPAAHPLRGNREAFVWGYGHLVIFASTAAVGAGIAFLADRFAVPHDLPEPGGLDALFHVEPTALDGLAVGVPVALYVAVTWILHVRPHRCGPGWVVAYFGAAALAIAGSLTPWPLPAVGLVLATLVTFTIVSASRAHGRRSD